MPGPLKNPKHEAFAQALARGKSQGDAYAAAGYSVSAKSAMEAASRLSRNVKVAARVAELQEKAAAKTVTTVEDIARQLDEDRELARANKQSAAAVSATMGKAKLLGFLVDHVVADVKHSFTDLADDELDREIGQLVADAGARRK